MFFPSLLFVDDDVSNVNQINEAATYSYFSLLSISFSFLRIIFTIPIRAAWGIRPDKIIDCNNLFYLDFYNLDGKNQNCENFDFYNLDGKKLNARTSMATIFT